MKKSIVVFDYFKKEFPEGFILLQINPHDLTGTELMVSSEGNMKKEEREFDEEIYDDLEEDGFEKGNPLEFNLYLEKYKKAGK
ncbi:hypothetical protein OO013_17765 [Mangrovivirga sp. M17]|uniref:Uncharacterized protein n=1 Tax=Mangrovivirga halotolerans TaxID=2993936 RepID=A0ABT3RX77_9BACT|nr:hypothetical protein [Mangrovivirga halotolerans]MCX2745735.1 hypothetical protein [Mangrovivirga halotolerans]